MNFILCGRANDLNIKRIREDGTHSSKETHFVLENCIYKEEEIIGGDITVTVEPGKAPKLSRKSSQKVISRPPILYDDMPDSTEEASTVFQIIKDCIYGSKHMGSSEHDALDCDCSEQWSEFIWSQKEVLY